MPGCSITLRCAFCGTPFSVPPSVEKAGRKFCRRACFALARKGTPAQFWAKVEKTDGCWLFTGAPAGDGYCQFGAGPTRRAHRFSYELHFGPIPAGLQVLHHCDEPRCVRPDHLYAGTHQDNMDDKKRRNRNPTGARHRSVTHPESVPRGERHGMAKLTEAQVRDIRRRYTGARGQCAAFAREFGVAHQTMKQILDGRHWKDGE